MLVQFRSLLAGHRRAEGATRQQRHHIVRLFRRCRLRSTLIAPGASVRECVSGLRLVFSSLTTRASPLWWTAQPPPGGNWSRPRRPARPSPLASLTREDGSGDEFRGTVSDHDQDVAALGHTTHDNALDRYGRSKRSPPGSGSTDDYVEANHQALVVSAPLRLWELRPPQTGLRVAERSPIAEMLPAARSRPLAGGGSRARA